MNKELMEKLDMLSPLLDGAEDSQLKVLARFLAERIISPDSFVTFLGETSSGKSTLINGLLGKALLPVRSCPTTGAISEIILSIDKTEDHFYAISKSASIKEIDKEQCLSLIEYPDDDLSRVRIITPAKDNRFQNMRIFDTPGYDSIVEQHEEILKEFLPNSDIAVYTVMYKIGIQDNDRVFLEMLSELTDNNTEIILVINRCPRGTDKNSSRINEIKNYVKDILKTDVHCFMVFSETPADEDSYALPYAEDLLNCITQTVNSEKRQQILYETFNDYIIDLYNGCVKDIEKQYMNIKLEKEDLEYLIKEQKETAERIRLAGENIVIPGFKKITDQIPRKLKEASLSAEKNITHDIENTDTFEMDEMIAYTNNHLVTYYIKQESKNIQDFIENILEDMNRRVDDYINKELIEFNNKITVKISAYKEAAIRNIGGNIIKKTGKSALARYFIQFGGKGGANAGIANAASHLLKKIGDLFGKTFSRETHNALKHTLAKIGATSMKAVGTVLTVIIELIMTAVEYGTWKKKLIKAIGKATDSWASETEKQILDDLETLKQENIETLNTIADDIENTFSSESTFKNSEEEILKLLDLCEEIGKKLGVK